VGLEQRPYIGSWKLNDKEIIQHTPDCLVYLNGDVTIPGGFDSSKSQRRINIQPYITSVSVDGGTSPGAASASLSLSIPVHSKDPFVRDAQFILRPGLEVHVYMRGYFPVRGLWRDETEQVQQEDGTYDEVHTKFKGEVVAPLAKPGTPVPLPESLKDALTKKPFGISATSAEGKRRLKNAGIIYEQFRQAGWSPSAATAFLNQAFHESGFNSEVYTARALGMFQAVPSPKIKAKGSAGAVASKYPRDYTSTPGLHTTLSGKTKAPEEAAQVDAKGNSDINWKKSWDAQNPYLSAAHEVHIAKEAKKQGFATQSAEAVTERIYWSGLGGGSWQGYACRGHRPKPPGPASLAKTKSLIKQYKQALKIATSAPDAMSQIQSGVPLYDREEITAAQQFLGKYSSNCLKWWERSVLPRGTKTGNQFGYGPRLSRYGARQDTLKKLTGDLEANPEQLDQLLAAEEDRGRALATGKAFTGTAPKKVPDTSQPEPHRKRPTDDILAYPYYAVFHGVVTQCDLAYSGGFQTATINCASMLHFWQYQNMSTNASYLGARPSQSKLRMSLVGNNFTGQHPYQIIYTLFHDTAGAAGGVGWALSSKTNQKANVHGQSLFSLNLQYWQKRFNSGRMMKLRLHGANGQLFNSAQAAFLGRLSSSAIGRVFRARWPGAASTRKTLDIKTANTLGLLGSPKLQRGTSGLSDLAAKRTDPTLQGATFVNRESDSYRSKDHSLNIFEMIPYVKDLGQIGQINFFESTYESKNDIVENICNLTSFEFFQDVDGDFVFKPPMYNMDTSASRVYRLEDIDIIDISFSEKEPQATYITGKNAGFKNLLGTGIENEWGVRGQFIDYRLVAQFGWRPTSFETTYLANPRSLYFACVNRLDILNVEMNTASCTIPIRPEIRVGYPFYIRYMDAFYYCNSFSHSWSAGGRCTTSLQLVGKRAKFYAPGAPAKVKTSGVEAIDLGNTILPPTPLTVLAGDQTVKLTGFPNVVMALDPFKINPLFFIIGADMDDMTDPQVLRNVFEFALTNTTNVITQKGLHEYEIVLPDTRRTGSGTKTLKVTLDSSVPQGDGVSKPFNIQQAAQEHGKQVQGEIGSKGSVQKANDKIKEETGKLNELKSQWADAQSEMSQIQAAKEAIRKKLHEGAIAKKEAKSGSGKGDGRTLGIKDWDKTEKALFKSLLGKSKAKDWATVVKKMQARIQGFASKIQQMEEAVKTKSAEAEVRLADNKEIATFLEIIQAIGGNFFKSGREGRMWSDLASSHNLLDMLSDRKASFTNGQIPGHYRYFSSSHPDPSQQGSGFKYEANWDDGGAGIEHSGAFKVPVTGSLLIKKAGMEIQPGLRSVDTELKLVEGGVKKGLYIISPTGAPYVSPWGEKAEQVGTGNKRCFRLLTPTAAIRTIEFQVSQVLRKGSRPARMSSSIDITIPTTFPNNLRRILKTYAAAQLVGLSIDDAHSTWVHEIVYAKWAPELYEAVGGNLTINSPVQVTFNAETLIAYLKNPANKVLSKKQIKTLTSEFPYSPMEDNFKYWALLSNQFARKYVPSDGDPIVYARMVAGYWQAILQRDFLHLLMDNAQLWTEISLGLPPTVDGSGLDQKQAAAAQEVIKMLYVNLQGWLGSFSGANLSGWTPTPKITWTNSAKKSSTRMIQTPVFPVSDEGGYTVVGSYAYGRGLSPYPDSELDQLTKADPQGAVDPITLRNYVDRVLRGKKIYEQVTVTHKGVKISKKQPINTDVLQKQLIKEIRESFTNQQLIDMGIAKMSGDMIEFNLRNWISDNRDSTFQIPVLNAAFSLADMSFHDILPNVDELRSAESDVLISALKTDFTTIVGSQDLDKMIEFANAVSQMPTKKDGEIDVDPPSQNLFFSMLEKAGKQH